MVQKTLIERVFFFQTFKVINTVASLSGKIGTGPVFSTVKKTIAETKPFIRTLRRRIMATIHAIIL